MSDEGEVESDDTDEEEDGENDDKVTMWRVVRGSTQRGDWEYDDSGGYTQGGSEAVDLPALYASEEEAQAEATRLNQTPMTWEDDGYGETPFYDPDDESIGDDVTYAQRVLLPWPVFKDYLKDHDLPPVREEDDPEHDKEPSVYELSEWWNEVLEGDDQRKMLKGVVRGPALYHVSEVVVSTAEIDTTVRSSMTQRVGGLAAEIYEALRACAKAETGARKKAYEVLNRIDPNWNE